MPVLRQPIRGRRNACERCFRPNRYNRNKGPILPSSPVRRTLRRIHDRHGLTSAGHAGDVNRITPHRGNCLQIGQVESVIIGARIIIRTARLERTILVVVQAD